MSAMPKRSYISLTIKMLLIRLVVSFIVCLGPIIVQFLALSIYSTSFCGTSLLSSYMTFK